MSIVICIRKDIYEYFVVTDEFITDKNLFLKGTSDCNLVVNLY